MPVNGTAIFKDELTYNMPNDVRGKVKYLSDLMGVGPNIVTEMGEAQSCEVLTGIVLYHHLPSGGRERRAVLESIYAAPGPMRTPLLNKVTDPMINPLWGIWAMKKEELFSEFEYFDAVSTFGSLMGVSFSASSGAQAVRDLRNKNFKMASVQVFLATVVAWGFFWNNEGAKLRIREELFRRAGKQVS